MRGLVWCILALLLAGCASGDPPAVGWSFTMRGEDGLAQDLAPRSDTFAVALDLAGPPGTRQLGGHWHGPLAKDEPYRLSFDASVPIRVEFRVRDASSGTASGTCNWAANSTDIKPVGIGAVAMRSTPTTCEITFTPAISVAGGSPSTWQWEARAAEPQPDGWMVAFRGAQSWPS